MMRHDRMEQGGSLVAVTIRLVVCMSLFLTGCATSRTASHSVVRQSSAGELTSSSQQPSDAEATVPAGEHVVRKIAATSDDLESVPFASPADMAADSLTEVDSFLDADSTLDELIAFALANNPEVQAVHMQAHALGERVPQVSALDDPMLMTTAFLEPIQTAAGPQDVVLSLTQKFPWFGKRDLRGQVAGHEAQAAFARLAAAQLTVIEQVKLAYFEWYFLEQAIRVNRQLEPQLQDVISIARVKYETAAEKTGLETVLQAQIELSTLQTMLVQLEQAREKSRAQLLRVLHAPPGANLSLNPTIPQSDVAHSAEILVSLMETGHPQLEAIRREQYRDRMAITLSQKEYYPDVTFGLNWHAVGSSGLSPAANGRDAVAAMVGINLPIYQEKRDAAVRESQFRLAQSSQRYAATWDELRAQVQSLHAQAIEHDRIVTILENDILPRSEQSLKLSIEAYQVDRITYQQLIEAYKTLLRQQIEYHRRLSQREQAIAQLERSVGSNVLSWPSAVDAETH